MKSSLTVIIIIIIIISLSPDTEYYFVFKKIMMIFDFVQEMFS